MSISTPTKPFHFFDVPEVVRLTPKFVYNFYQNDETIDESGTQGVRGNLGKKYKNRRGRDITNLNARVPRYVKLNWIVQDCGKPSMNPRQSRAQKKFDRKQLQYLLDKGLIYTETLASGKDHDSYFFGNQSLPNALNNMWKSRFTSLDLPVASRLQMLGHISKDSEVENETLQEMLPTVGKRGNVDNSYLAAEKVVWGAGSINTSYAPFVLRPHVDRGNDLLWPETVSKFLDATSKFEVDDRCHVSNAEYVFDVPFVHVEKASSTNFVGSSRIVGYVFEKWREWKGRRYKMPAVIAVGSNLRTAFDSEVAYGQTYMYSARTIAEIQVPFTDYETGKTFIGTFFLASRPSAIVRETCTEDRDPPWPADINFYFDYAKKNLRLTWAPPVNSQQDVKYIQVYRRSSVEEPFTLLRHFDFDDSVIRLPMKENIETTLIEDCIPPVGEGMPTTWVDTEFTKESSYIYSIVAIDARQNSSAYSPQIKVTFDETKNRIHKESISPGGAPKQYPNWFLKENFFSDCIKDSMHRDFTVYFDPECFTINKSVGNAETIERVLTTKQDDPLARYVFQFINTDRLLEAKLEVTLDAERLVDKNRTIDKTKSILATAKDLSGRFV